MTSETVHTFSVGLGATLACAALAMGAGAGPHPTRLFVLDSGVPALFEVDPLARRLERRVDLSGQPSRFLATPDGTRLLILDRGRGKDEGERGWATTERSTLTVVDADTMAAVGKVELGWGLTLDQDPVMSADGSRLAVLCPGYRAKKVEQRLPTELVIVDIAAMKQVARVALEGFPLRVMAAAKGRLVCALVPGPSKKGVPAEASLTCVGIEDGRVTQHVSVNGKVTEMLPSADGKLAYLLDPGHPSKNPKKNIDGRLYVVALGSSDAPPSVLDAASNPHGMALDRESGALLVLAESTPAKGVQRTGKLLVVNGDALTATLPVTQEPALMRYSPDGKRLLVLGAKGLSVVSLPAFDVIRDVPIEGAGTNWLSDAQPGDPNDLATTGDGSRGLVTYQNSSKLLLLDLQSGAKVASVTTGRKGAKLAWAAAATAMNAASYYSARETAVQAHQGSFVYTTYSPRAASTAIALAPDSRFAYVLNSQSDDVTIVGTATGDVVEKLAGGGYAIDALPGGRVLAVVWPNGVHLIDTTHNASAGSIELPGLLGIETAPDKSVVVALGEKGIVFLSPVSGKVEGRIDAFQGSTDGRFVVRRAAKPESTPPPKKAPPKPAAKKKGRSR